MSESSSPCVISGGNDRAPAQEYLGLLINGLIENPVLITAIPQIFAPRVHASIADSTTAGETTCIHLIRCHTILDEQRVDQGGNECHIIPRVRTVVIPVKADEGVIRVLQTKR